MPGGEAHPLQHHVQPRLVRVVTQDVQEGLRVAEGGGGEEQVQFSLRAGLEPRGQGRAEGEAGVLERELGAGQGEGAVPAFSTVKLRSWGAPPTTAPPK